MKLRRFFHACLLTLGFNLAASPADAQAKARLVMDAQSGKILYQENGDRLLHPASTTKVLTAYLVFEALEAGTLKLDQKIKVSSYAANRPRTNLSMIKSVPVKKTITVDGKKKTVTRYVRKQVVTEMTVDQALRAMLVHSANDASVVLAEAIAGSEAKFAALMNKKAKELGMTHSTFRNPNGWENPQQKSTAADMARLFRATIRDFPAYYPYFSLTQFTFNGTTYHSHNKMLGKFEGVEGKTPYPGFDGGKTGYFRNAGCNLVASVTKDGQRVIAVVFGAPTGKERTAQMVSLLDIGFSKIEPRPATEMMAEKDRTPALPLDDSTRRTLCLPVIADTLLPRKISGMPAVMPRPPA